MARKQMNKGHEMCPPSEILAAPNKSKLFQMERDRMFGYAKKIKRGINPTQVKHGSREEE